jgi:hypothetical protein
MFWVVEGRQSVSEPLDTLLGRQVSICRLREVWVDLISFIERGDMVTEQSRDVAETGLYPSDFRRRHLEGSNPAIPRAPESSEIGAAPWLSICDDANGRFAPIDRNAFRIVRYNPVHSPTDCLFNISEIVQRINEHFMS